MLKIDDEVERYHRRHNSRPKRYFVVMEQPPVPRLGEDGHADSGGWKDEANDETVQEDDTEVVRPAYRLRDGERPFRRGPLPDGHEAEDAEKATKTKGDFVLGHELADVHETIPSFE